MVAMLRPVEPFIEYALNHDYIAEVLCINKKKPELNCDGKCYLMQQLKKQQKGEQTPLKISMENYPIGFVNILNIEHRKSIIPHKKPIFLYYVLYYFNYNDSAFHPPELA